jgi:sodium/proline symporter
MNVYDKLKDPFAFSIFLLTLLFPIAIGLLAMRRTKNQSDFYVGGRAMDKFVVALSAVSSGRSSWLILGLSGIAYKLGVGAVWAIIGYITVEALQFIFLGRKLRKDSQSMGAITLLDYFAGRYRDNRHIIRITGAVIIGIFITAYVSAQFNAGAKTLSAAMEIPFGIALLVAGLLILIYMVLGGFVAVAYNDVVRAIIMLIGLVVLPIVGIINIGGTGILFSGLEQLAPKYVDPMALGLGATIGFLGIGLGSPGQPHIVVRYMSIDNPDNLKFSAVIGTIWNIILGVGAICIGLIGRAVFPETGMLPQNDPEMIYLMLSSEYFGPLLYGLLVGGIFAAILSTADSQLLVVASTVSRDLYEKIFLKNQAIDEKKILVISRFVVIGSGIIAILLAFIADDLVFWLVLFAWGGLGASIGPALILSLFWKKTTKYGVVAGMITGMAVTIIWKIFLKGPTGIYELIPAFFGALLVIVVVSLLGAKEEFADHEPNN